MSRRHRPDDSQDALELFLDAISNVFGGILFIALAVVVLLQFSTQSPVDAEVTPSSAAPDTETLRTVGLEIAVLESLLQASPSADRVDSDRYRVMLAELDVAVLEIQRLRQREQESRRQQAEARQSVETLARRVSSLETELLEARSALDDAHRMPLDRQRVGRFRETAKREVPMMVTAGRLVEVFRSESTDGKPLLNAEALSIDSVSQRARPKPGVGMAIIDGPAGDASLTALLARFDPGRDYLSIAVWPDGFVEGIRLRDTAIDLGFEFALTPIPPGQGVPFKAASGVQ